MAEITKDLGRVTAYKYAVDHGGYSGTEEEFGQLLAQLPAYTQEAQQAVTDVHEEIENANLQIDMIQSRQFSISFCKIFTFKSNHLFSPPDAFFHFHLVSHALSALFPLSQHVFLII